jgi:hypothetical protein
MAELNEMEMAIMDAVRQGKIDREAIGKHARGIINDYDAYGPTLWTEATVRKFADTLDDLVEKGYLSWATYLLQAEATDKGKKFIADNTAALEGLPKVDDSSKWFRNQNKKIVRKP